MTVHIAAAAGDTRPDRHPHGDDDDTGKCVPLCAPHEVMMHGEHSGHSTCCNLAATEVRVCACV